MTLTITHTHEAETLIEGTSKGDGTDNVLKRVGWHWGHSIATSYIPNSRDHLPHRGGARWCYPPETTHPQAMQN